MRTLKYAVLAALLAAGCGSDEPDAGAADAATEAEAEAEAETGSAADADSGPEPEPEPDLPSDPPPEISLSGAQSAAACESVSVSATIEGDVSEVRWAVAGEPVLHLARSEPHTVTFRAPVVGIETALAVSATAVGPTGSEATATTTVTVAAAPVGEGLALGMALDCAPFAHGVSSGDPLPTSVLLWTRIEVSEDTPVGWAIATDHYMEDVVASGEATASADRDYTVMVEAGGLEPGTTYYYRFSAPDGRVSRLGRTKTAPVGPVERVRLASMSCSSVWSGYFNAYRGLANKELDLAIHLGDYVYDFVDAEEEVRMPPGAYPKNPGSLEEWRERYRYYLSDPDFRAARGAHPWLVIWDNHDSDGIADEEQSNRVFWEYVPSRMLAPESKSVVYRSLRYGDLVHILLLDSLLWRTEGDMLGEPQWQWFEGELDGSAADWRVVGNQKLTTQWLLPPIPGYDDTSPWDGYPASRARLYDNLGQTGDNLLISGDLHFTMIHDIVLDPDDPEQPYDPETGERAVGGELLAAGISRGNFDETLCAGLCDGNALMTDILSTVPGELYAMNPHSVFYELIEHGYAVIDITPARIEAQMWYSAIRQPTREERLGVRVTMERGANRWSRPPQVPEEAQE